MPVTLKPSQAQQNLPVMVLRERLQRAADVASARAAHLTEEEIEALIEDARSENHQNVIKFSQWHAARNT